MKNLHSKRLKIYKDNKSKKRKLRSKKKLKRRKKKGWRR